MPVGTAFHERTLALCESLNYREWAGYYTVSAYETHHEHEYNAIRNASALIDITPLYKYRVSGRGKWTGSCLYDPGPGASNVRSPVSCVLVMELLSVASRSS